MSGYTYLVAIIANLMSFSTGIGITWSSPELKKLENDPDMHMTSEEGSWIASLFPLGAIAGPFTYGLLADIIGRKYTLLILGIQFTIGNFLMSFLINVPAFLVARLIFGIGSTGVLTVLPMYLAEIAVTENRGLLTSLISVFLSIGQLFSYIVGPYVSIMVFNLILAIIPGVTTIAFFLLAPESPHYFVRKKYLDQARQTLKKLRGQSADIEEELLEIEKATQTEPSRNFLDIFDTKGTTKAFYIALAIFIFHQFTGIKAVVLYTEEIFDDAGAPLDSAVCSIISGSAMVLASSIAPSVIEKTGRKKLLLVSLIGICLSELPLGVFIYLKDHGTNLEAISFLPIICMMLIILFFSLGIGTVSWTILSELFPDKIKATASSAVVTVNSILAFFVAKYFESVSVDIGMGVCFLIFSGLCAVAVVFVHLFLLETGGKTFEEIQKELNQ